MDWILENFGEEHHIRKEDVIIVSNRAVSCLVISPAETYQVIGTLSAHNYAMLVSNFAPRVTVDFNVHADRHPKEEWGTWTIDQKPSADQLTSYKYQAKQGGEYDQPRFCCKVSKISASPRLVYLSLSTDV